MRLESLHLHAVSSAFPGSVTLTLRDLPRGLIAVVGPNGHGKTFLLEAGLAALHRALPSRDHPLVDYAIARDAFIEAEYSLDGAGVFRARVSLDGDSRQTKAVLSEVQANGAGVTLTDGKVSTFDALVRARFPSYDLMLTSVFACQTKRGSFSERKPAQRKILFAEFLGLRAMEQMAQTAGQAARLFDDARRQVGIERDTLGRVADPAFAQQLARRARDLDVEQLELEGQRTTLGARLDTLGTAQAALRDQVEAHRVASAKLATATAAASARQAEIDQIARDVEALDREATAERSRLDVRLATDSMRLDQQRALLRAEVQTTRDDLDARLANNQKVLENAAAIRAAADEQAELRTQVAARRADEERQRLALASAEAEARIVEADLAATAGEAARIPLLRRATEVMTTVPCHGADAYAGCQFLADAAEAQRQLPEKEAHAREAQHLTTIAKDHAEHVRTIKASLDECRRTIAEHEQRIAELQPIAKLLDHVARAEDRIAEYQRQRAETGAAFDARLLDLDAAHTDLSTRHAADSEAIAERRTTKHTALTDRRSTAILALREAQAALTAASADVEATAHARAEMAQLERDLTTARAEWTRIEAALAAQTVRRQELDRARVEYETHRLALVDAEQRLATLVERQRTWALLAKALGKDGIQTLEIDMAGPAVTAATNDLLAAAAMSRFSVDLVTQVPKVDGELKESFELRVWDNERGGEWRDLADLSGGERVLIEEAFRCGLALHMNTKNERPIRTCWRDETTGALDPVNAPRYVAMLRRMQEIGGFDQTLFISHNLDVAAMADAQVLVANGELHVVQMTAPELERWLASVTNQVAA